MFSDVEILVRLLVALALSAALGWERESLGKPAGLRTHVLVGVGAALAIAVSHSLVEPFREVDERLRFDPIRVVEAVLTSIGFLGAGTIIFQRGEARVSGLTTAASIWATAVVGLTAGAGRFLLAAGAALIIFLVLRGLGWLEHRFMASHGGGTSRG